MGVDRVSDRGFTKRGVTERNTNLDIRKIYRMDFVTDKFEYPLRGIMKQVHSISFIKSCVYMINIC